ncbi:DUF362 domain-containing protein [Candidatus Bathyarchaeota archaeon]|nr:DUF362 domain-containing protein [Candidatus Bathyarchaeota archaeon]
MSLVSLVKIKDYNIKQAVEEALNLIGYNFPSNVGNIIIKPNLCYYWDYTTGQTTDPKLVAELIRLIREETSKDVNISIVESDASAMICKYAFRMLGYEKLAENCNVKLVNLSEEEASPADVTIGGKTFRFMVPKIIRKADVKINVPKIKYTLRGIELTCALKNIYGCNPYPKKFKYHEMLAETIVALNKLMKFDLHIVDGNIVSGIHPRKLGLVMASQDPVSLDTAAAEIAGLKPKKIEYLQLAEKEGLGRALYIPKGTPIKYFKSRYPKKDFKKKLMDKAYAFLIFTGLNKKLGI